MAVGVLAGIRSHSFWEDTQETYDFFDAKGIIEAIFANLGVQVDYIPSKNNTVKIGHSAELFIDGTQVGMIGEINPLSINKFNHTWIYLSIPTYIFKHTYIYINILNIFNILN